MFVINDLPLVLYHLEDHDFHLYQVIHGYQKGLRRLLVLVDPTYMPSK